MAGDVAEAFVRIRPKADGSFEREANQQIGDPLKKIATAAAGLFAGKQIFDQFRGAVTELGEAEKVAAQTQATIRSTGGAAKVTAGDVSQLSGSLSELSGKDDELIQQGQNLLLTFKGVRNEVGQGNNIFDRASAAALDLSVALGQDMSSSALQLGKALDNPIQGITALRRAGVSFTEAQQAQIKALVESGNTLEAQKIILSEVESQVGGSAKAYGETLPGSLERAKNSFDEAKASIVGQFGPSIKLGADLVGQLSKVIQDLPAPAQTAIGVVVGLSSAVVSLAPSFNVAFTAFKNMQQSGLNFASVAGKVGLGLGALSVVTIGATFILDRYAKQKAEAKRVTDLYRDAIAKETGSMMENVDAATAQELAQGKLGTKLRTTGADFATLFDAVRQYPAQIKQLSENIDVSATAFDELRQLLKDTGLAGSEFSDELIRLTETQGFTSKDLNVLLQRLRELSGGYANATEQNANLKSATQGVADAQKVASGDIDKTNEALDDQSEAAQEAKKKIDEATLAILGHIDAQAGYESAVDGASDALRDYNEKLDAVAKANKSDLPAALEEADDALRGTADSYRAQAKAALDLANQQATANGTTLDATTQTLIYKGELQKLADQLDPASPLRQKLQGYIDQIRDVPKTVSTTLVLEQRGTIPAAGGAVRRRARGGNFMAGEPIVVGEDGAELVEFSRPGRIIPNNQIAAQGNGGGGGITVYGDLVLGDREAVNDLDHWARAKLAKVA